MKTIIWQTPAFINGFLRHQVVQLQLCQNFSRYVDTGERQNKTKKNISINLMVIPGPNWRHLIHKLGLTTREEKSLFYTLQGQVRQYVLRSVRRASMVSRPDSVHALFLLKGEFRCVYARRRARLLAEVSARRTATSRASPPSHINTMKVLWGNKA